MLSISASTTFGLLVMASPVLGTIRPMWWFQLHLQRPQQLLQPLQPQFHQCHLHDGADGNEAEPEDSMEQSIQAAKKQMIAGFVAISMKETKSMRK